jgi:hypothetical protein
MISPELISVVCGMAGAAVMGGFALIPYIQKYNGKIDKVLEGAKIVLDTSDAIADKLKPVVPIKDYTIAKAIIKATDMGVNRAEQLLHEGNITPEERYKNSLDAAHLFLSVAKINLDADSELLLEYSIKSAINKLGHANDTPIVVKNENVKMPLSADTINTITEKVAAKLSDDEKSVILEEPIK